MSGIKPFFLSGSNAKIKLNGKTLAFCTDLSYSVQIAHQTPKVLGMYEGISVEPTGYTVSGSFTVVRYVKDALGSASENFPNASAHGNGIGNWGTVWQGTGGILSASGVGNDGRAHEGLNPSRFAESTTFDIQIYQKVNTRIEGASTFTTALEILSGGSPTANEGNLIGVANIRSCRITQADFSLSKKNVAIQRFNFVGLYVDEDAFAADSSGKGQQFDGGA